MLIVQHAQRVRVTHFHSLGLNVKLVSFQTPLMKGTRCVPCARRVKAQIRRRKVHQMKTSGFAKPVWRRSTPPLEFARSATPRILSTMITLSALDASPVKHPTLREQSVSHVKVQHSRRLVWSAKIVCHQMWWCSMLALGHSARRVGLGLVQVLTAASVLIAPVPRTQR